MPKPKPENDRCRVCGNPPWADAVDPMLARCPACGGVLTPLWPH